MRLGCFFAGMLIGVTSASAEVPLTWGPHRDLTAAARPDGVIEITLGTGNPHFWTGVVPPSFDPSRHRVFELEIFAPSVWDSAVLRFRTARQAFQHLSFQEFLAAEAFVKRAHLALG